MIKWVDYKNFKIKIFDDSSFFNSIDSPTRYTNNYETITEDKHTPSSRHAIIIFEDEIELNSAILLGYSGATGIYEDDFIIKDNQLIIRCSNVIFNLDLPSLKLNWMQETDWATCFSIHSYQEDIISYGELSIKRLNVNGNIIWDYGGRDIFVSLNGSNPFCMHENYIELIDFENNVYKIDYDGKEL